MTSPFAVTINGASQGTYQLTCHILVYLYSASANAGDKVFNQATGETATAL